jgi:hypothetical protein
LGYGIGREGEGKRRLENSEQELLGKHPTHFSFAGTSCAGPPTSRHLHESSGQDTLAMVMLFTSLGHLGPPLFYIVPGDVAHTNNNKFITNWLFRQQASLLPSFPHTMDVTHTNNNKYVITWLFA